MGKFEELGRGARSLYFISLFFCLSPPLGCGLLEGMVQGLACSLQYPYHLKQKTKKPVAQQVLNKYGSSDRVTLTVPLSLGDKDALSSLSSWCIAKTEVCGFHDNRREPARPAAGDTHRDCELCIFSRCSLEIGKMAVGSFSKRWGKRRNFINMVNSVVHWTSLSNESINAQAGSSDL